MSRKTVLNKVVIILTIVGFLLVLIPFFSSLNPSSRADAALERIRISDIPKGKYFISRDSPVYGNAYNGYDWGYMIYRKNDGTLRIWNVPIKGKFVGLPDRIWEHPAFPCEYFGPTIKNGKVDELAPIKCHDGAGYPAPDMAWDIDGRAIGGLVSDMVVTKGVIENDYFIFGKTE